jgi:hypothetical protein
MAVPKIEAKGAARAVAAREVSIQRLTYMLVSFANNRSLS